jgi:ATP-binding cassette subfamily B protein
MPRAIGESLPSLWRTLRRFRSHLRKERGTVAASLAALLAATGLRLLEPWPLKFVFDRVIAVGGGRPAAPFLAHLPTGTLIGLAAVALVAITGLRALADYLNSVGFARVGGHVVARVRSEVYRHLQALSLSFHSGARNGDLVVRVIADVNRLKDALVSAVLPLFASAVTLLALWALMFRFEWRLAMLALAPAPLLWISVLRLTRRIRETASRQRQREGAMAAAAAESIGAIKVVQALSLESTFAASFERGHRSSEHEELKGSRLSAGLERRVDVLLAVATAIVLWRGAHLVVAGALSPGDLVVFLAYLKRAFNPVQDFAKYAARLAKAAAAGERVTDLLDRAPDVRDSDRALPAPALRGSVTFEGVSFGYEPGQRVLDGVHLDIPAGQLVAVVGPSGIGKSTLGSLLLRLYDPTEGRVLIDGRDVREFTLSSLRAQLGVVLQESVLFGATVRDNIAFGAPGSSPEEVEAAARLANAHAFITALPGGYDSVVGERGATLSGGERQRIAVARAAVRRAPILILDEPTAGLDGDNEREVRLALARLARGRTTLLITHDLTFAAEADRVVYLEGGRLVESGSHAELVAAGGRYARLCEQQGAAQGHFGDEHALPS